MQLDKSFGQGMNFVNMLRAFDFGSNCRCRGLVSCKKPHHRKLDDVRIDEKELRSPVALCPGHGKTGTAPHCIVAGLVW